mmetsp:Transcript_95878/g.260293  ORF Transcript_95878/g.260293 Transcript_95878/m.260293 type:complete len:345 (-) Transcript_95878:48-1082(-)
MSRRAFLAASASASWRFFTAPASIVHMDRRPWKRSKGTPGPEPAALLKRLSSCSPESSHWNSAPAMMATSALSMWPLPPRSYNLNLSFNLRSLASACARLVTRSFSVLNDILSFVNVSLWVVIRELSSLKLTFSSWPVSSQRIVRSLGPSSAMADGRSFSAASSASEQASTAPSACITRSSISAGSSTVVCCDKACRALCASDTLQSASSANFALSLASASQRNTRVSASATAFSHCSRMFSASEPISSEESSMAFLTSSTSFSNSALLMLSGRAGLWSRWSILRAFSAATCSCRLLISSCCRSAISFARAFCAASFASTSSLMRFFRASSSFFRASRSLRFPS